MVWYHDDTGGDVVSLWSMLPRISRGGDAMNVRAKGMSGEYEFCDWLFRKGLVLVPPKRNLEQVRYGGIDIIPADHPFVYEVKRVETITELTLDKWWLKANVDRVKHNRLTQDEREAVVAYRRNKGDWTFLISVENLLGVHGSYAIVKTNTFIKYAQRRIAGYQYAPAPGE